MKSKLVLAFVALAIAFPFGATANAETTDTKGTDAQQSAQKAVGDATKTLQQTTTKLQQQQEQAQQQQEQQQEAQARDEAKAKVEAARAAAQSRKIALKQDICQAHKAQLIEQIPALSKSVTTIKQTLDSKYSQITAIYNSGKLTVSNYTTLNAQVLVAQQAAAAAVAAIDPGTITIDCNNNNLGMQLDSFRSTLDVARTALDNYRTTLVDLVSAMNASANAASNSSSTTTGGTN